METPQEQSQPGQAAAPQGSASQAPVTTSEPASGQASTQKAPETKEQKLVWNGDINALPDELKEYGKSVQRHLTTQSMAQAELKKKVQEYESTLNSEDYKTFQTWKQQNQTPNAGQVNQPQPVLTPEEWEAFQLDPSKANQILQNAFQRMATQYTQSIENRFQEMQHKDAVIEWKSTLQDFAQLHPEFVELHELGLMEPILRQTVDAGGTLEQAFERAVQIRDGMQARALKASQGRVNEKRNAVTSSANVSNEADIKYIGKNEDALEAAFNLAFEGKSMKVARRRD